MSPGELDGEDVSVIVEQMMRPIVAAPEFNEFGGLAMWVMSSQTLRHALPITGTLSRALGFGRALLAGELKDAGAVKPEEVKLARRVIETFEGPIDLAHFKDEYREGLQRIIDAKVAGEEVVAPAAEPGGGDTIYMRILNDTTMQVRQGTPVAEPITWKRCERIS